MRDESDKINEGMSDVHHRERYGRHSFSLSWPTLWNALPAAVRTVNSIAAFKAVLQTHIFRVTFIEHCFS